jgi:hypothetical protein
MTSDVYCRGCELKRPIVFDVQSKRDMHEGPAMSTFTCERLRDEQDRREREQREAHRTTRQSRPR